MPSNLVREGPATAYRLEGVSPFSSLSWHYINFETQADVGHTHQIIMTPDIITIHVAALRHSVRLFFGARPDKGWGWVGHQAWNEFVRTLETGVNVLFGR